MSLIAAGKSGQVPPAEILKCMTTNGADLQRIGKERGAIAPGLFADIIAMPADPLQDVESLRKVKLRNEERKNHS